MYIHNKQSKLTTNGYFLPALAVIISIRMSHLSFCTIGLFEWSAFE